MKKDIEDVGLSSLSSINRSLGPSGWLVDLISLDTLPHDVLPWVVTWASKGYNDRTDHCV